jgi:26S proteasome regulatory subunit N3
VLELQLFLTLSETADSPAKKALLNYVPPVEKEVEMEVDAPSTAASTLKPPPVTSEPVADVDVYLRLLAMLHLTNIPEHKKAIELAHETVEKIQSLNKRSLDPIAAKVYFCIGRLYEVAGSFDQIRSCV